MDWNSTDFSGSCGCMTHFLRFTDFYLSLVPLCAQITLSKLYRSLFLSRGEASVFICDQLCSRLQAQDVQKAYLVIVQQRISEWLKAKHPDQSLHRKEAKKVPQSNTVLENPQKNALKQLFHLRNNCRQVSFNCIWYNRNKWTKIKMNSLKL